MRSTFVQTVTSLADEGQDVYLMTGDLGFRLLDPFREKHPSRFINAGVAEANMVSAAAGMAMAGKKVFCYSMVPFVFMRAFEQIRLELCSQRLPVVIVGVGGGLSYGCEGHSHFAIEDLAMARALPNLVTIAPGDPAETIMATREAAMSSKPHYLRLGKNGDPAVHKSPPISLNNCIPVIEGNASVVVFATGHILARTADAIKNLAKEGISAKLYSVPMIKPLDTTTVRESLRTATHVISVEEHSMIGGLGSALSEILLESRYTGEFLKIGLPDQYCDIVGSHDYLVAQHGLDAAGIAKSIKSIVSLKEISK